jgi:hypothetical protein
LEQALDLEEYGYVALIDNYKYTFFFFPFFFPSPTLLFPFSLLRKGSWEERSYIVGLVATAKLRELSSQIFLMNDLRAAY